VVHQSVERPGHSNCKRKNVPPRRTFSQRGSCPAASSRVSILTHVEIHWYTSVFIQVHTNTHRCLVYGRVETIENFPVATGFNQELQQRDLWEACAKFKVSRLSTLAERRLCVLRNDLVTRTCMMYLCSVLGRLPCRPQRFRLSAEVHLSVHDS